MATRVLVVDDSPTIRRVVGSVLQRHGFEAIPAEDGQDGLDLLLQSAEAIQRGDGEATKIDIVLVDFVMPRMNGFQLCRAIRQNPLLRPVPIILMSAKSDRIREHFVQQTGAIDAIGKPFDSRALIAVIENAVRRADQWRPKADTLSVEFLDDLEVQDAASVQESDGDTALSGDLSVIPIGAVLQLLQLEGQTGTLVASDGKIEVTVAMRQGLIDLVQAHGAGNEFRLVGRARGHRPPATRSAVLAGGPFLVGAQAARRLAGRGGILYAGSAPRSADSAIERARI